MQNDEESEFRRLVGTENWADATALVLENPRVAQFAVHESFSTLATALDLASFSPEGDSFIRAVLNVNPGLFGIRSENGNGLPLDLAVLRSSVETVRTMLDVMLQAELRTENAPDITEIAFTKYPLQVDGELTHVFHYINPLTGKCRWYKGVIEATHAAIVFGRLNLEYIIRACEEFEEFWERVNLIVKAFYHKSVQDLLPQGKKWRLLHACAGIKHCPPHLLELVTASHPEQLVEFDENGNLPIHVAASASFPPYEGYHVLDGEDHPITEEDIRLNGTLKSTIEILIKARPTTARVRNINGKLPINLAIESGQDWDNGVDSLFEAFPGAIELRDKETGLFPFMLAAVGNTSSLTVVYNLFRSRPDFKSYAEIPDVAPPSAKRRRL